MGVRRRRANKIARRSADSGAAATPSSSSEPLVAAPAQQLFTLEWTTQLLRNTTKLENMSERSERDAKEVLHQLSAIEAKLAHLM